MLSSSGIDDRQRFTRRYPCAIDNIIRTILELGLLQTDVCFYVRKSDIHCISILFSNFDWDIVTRARSSLLASYRYDAEHEARQPAAVVQALIGRGSEAIHRHYVSVGFEALKKAALALADPL